MQHAWKLNGVFPPVPQYNVDGDMAFGFTGKINFALFKRRKAGSAGSSTFDIKKKVAGVYTTIFTVTPTVTAAAGDDGISMHSGTDLAITTFGPFDNFRFDILTKEAGAPRDVVGILDVTRTA